MAREITVVTPENATISYELAGFGSRTLAYLLDVMLQGSMLMALYIFIIVGSIAFAALRLHESSMLMDVFQGLFFIVLFAIVNVYYILFEIKWNGQTPGKKILGIRVIKEEGAPVTTSAVIIRNLIRLIELTILPIIAVVSVLASSKYKRLGDYAAGTIVVKERSQPAAGPQIKQVDLNEITLSEAEYVQDVDMLTREEIAAIRRYLERKNELDESVKESIAEQLAGTIMTRLNIERPSGYFSYANFLEEIYKEAVEQRGLV